MWLEPQLTAFHQSHAEKSIPLGNTFGFRQLREQRLEKCGLCPITLHFSRPLIGGRQATVVQVYIYWSLLWYDFLPFFRYGRKRTLIAGVFGCAIGHIAMTFSPSYVLYTGSLFVIGVFSTPLTQSSFTLGELKYYLQRYVSNLFLLIDAYNGQK